MKFGKNKCRLSFLKFSFSVLFLCMEQDYFYSMIRNIQHAG